MQSQLILQFRGDARRFFDAVPDSAARLAEAVGETASLDGEDAGAHGVNLFLFTADPGRTLADALAVFPGVESAPGFMAASRQVSSESFHVLWPAGTDAAFRLR